MNVNGILGLDVFKMWNGIWSGMGNKKIKWIREESFKIEFEVIMYVCWKINYLIICK